MTEAGLVDTTSHALARLLGDWSGPGPAHRRLTELIRLLILDGRLPLGSRMPAERDLALTLGISRTTVATAYAALRDQGYLSSKDRSRSRTRVPPGGAAGPPEADATGPGLIDFTKATSPAPSEILHRAYDRALSQLPRYLPRHGYSAVGLGDLRSAIAERYRARGLPTSPEQIVVTNGALHALAMLTRALVRPRDRVVVDHPTYPHALRVFRDARARLVPVPLTETGWDLEGLAAAAPGARFAYLVPDFHNPTGLNLPAEERGRLRLGCRIVVDETMAELALDGSPAPPVAAYQADAISIGSASKVLWGGLRIGWIRADPELVQRVAQVRVGADLGTPVLEQLACVELLGELDAILPARLAELRRRRGRLLAAMAGQLPDWTVGASQGGLSVWARMPEPISSALAAVSPAYGVRLAAGPRFGVGGAFERFVRLPYSLDEGALAAAVAAIAAATDAVRAGRPHPTEPASAPLVGT